MVGLESTRRCSRYLWKHWEPRDLVKILIWVVLEVSLPFGVLLVRVPNWAPQIKVRILSNIRLSIQTYPLLDIGVQISSNTVDDI